MYGNYTFGPADLQHFIASTDSKTWATTADGKIDTTHPALGRWRSAIIAQFLNAARQSVANTGTDISIDVRTSPDTPTTGRAESGHDLTILSPTTDRITIWNYFGLNAYPPQRTRDIVEKLDATQLPEPYVLSIGLWNTPTQAEPGTEVSPDALATAVSSIPDLAHTSVQVTPASLMTSEHWDALSQAW